MRVTIRGAVTKIRLGVKTCSTPKNARTTLVDFRGIRCLSQKRHSGEQMTSERGDLFKKNYIGEVVIGSIVNDHFARASVNSGDVKPHDVVELEE